MTLVCECLNLKLKIQDCHDVNIVDLDLSPEEKSHPYFSKKVFKSNGKAIESSEVFPRLVQNEIVGSWNLCLCLICKIYTHGTNYTNGISTFSSDLKDFPSDIITYGLDRDYNYSQVYNIYFPSKLEVPDHGLSDSSIGEALAEDDFVEKIASQSKSFLEIAIHLMHYSSKAGVEKQAQAMDVLRRRVRSEQNFLLMIVAQSENYKENGFHSKSNSDFSHPPPHNGLQIGATNTSNTNENTDDPINQNPQTFNSQSYEDELRDLLSDLQLMSSRRNRPAPNPPEEEGIFDMDEFFDVDRCGPDSPRNEDSEEEDDEEEEEEDEDVADLLETLAVDPRYYRPKDIARSVPLDVPAWPRDFEDREIDTTKPHKPEEIADSMRKLARSVRMSSVDVFGDLP